MADEQDRLRAEVEYALRDSISAGLRNIGRELDSINRKAVEVGSVGNVFSNMRQETTQLGESVTRTNRALGVMGNFFTGFARGLLGPAGAVGAMAAVTYEMFRFAETRVQLTRFATDVGLTAREVRGLTNAFEQGGVPFDAAQQRIAQMMGSLKDFNVSYGSSQFKALVSLGLGDVAGKMVEDTRSGKWPEAMDALAKAYRDASAPIRREIENSFHMSPSDFLDWPRLREEMDSTKLKNSEVAEQAYKDWTSLKQNIRSVWQDVQTDVFETLFGPPSTRAVGQMDRLTIGGVQDAIAGRGKRYGIGAPRSDTSTGLDALTLGGVQGAVLGDPALRSMIGSLPAGGEAQNAIREVLESRKTEDEKRTERVWRSQFPSEDIDQVPPPGVTPSIDAPAATPSVTTPASSPHSFPPNASPHAQLPSTSTPRIGQVGMLPNIEHLQNLRTQFPGVFGFSNAPNITPGVPPPGTLDYRPPGLFPDFQRLDELRDKLPEILHGGKLPDETPTLKYEKPTFLPNIDRLKRLKDYIPFLFKHSSLGDTDFSAARRMDGVRELNDIETDSNRLLIEIRDILQRMDQKAGGGASNPLSGSVGSGIGSQGGQSNSPSGPSGANFLGSDRAAAAGIRSGVDENIGTFQTKAGPITVNKSAANDLTGAVNALVGYGAPVGRVGSYSRRMIAGSNRWSQHAMGGALDLFNQIKRGIISPQGLAWIRSHPKEWLDVKRRFNLVGGEEFGDLGHVEWGGPGFGEKHYGKGDDREAGRSAIDRSLKGAEPTTGLIRADFDFSKAPSWLQKDEDVFKDLKIHRAPQAPKAGGSTSDYNGWSYE